MEIMQTDNLDEVYYGDRTHSTRYSYSGADWLRELLMDLPIVEKPLPVIMMNCDN
jgi:hypothetical protein